MSLSYSYCPPVTHTEILFDNFPPLLSTIAICDTCISLDRLPYLAPPLATIFLEANESLKSLENFTKLCNRLTELDCGPDTHIVAIGSGTLLDLVGFVASSYCRGVRLTSIPTTLLGMADASIGGKNGLNVLNCKNRVGSTYQPERIVIDVRFLETLPYSELQNGCVEMAKHALLDPSTGFEEDLPKILQCDFPTIKRALQKSIGVKLRYVMGSQQDPEIRHMLNLGHTIGHAIELLEDFKVSHGQAVAIGLMAEARLFSAPTQPVDALIAAIGIHLHLSRRYSLAEWQAAMLQDKKVKEGRPRFASLEGKCCVAVDSQKVERCLEWINDTFSTLQS